MPFFIFPDNTVLCNFAAVKRIDLLGSYVGDHGRWAQAVKFEETKSEPYFPALGELLDGRLLGEAIEIDDIDKVNRIRRGVFGGSDDEPLKHLGEAESCYIISTYAEYKQSIWLTDDGDAFEHGQDRGILTRDTYDCMQVLVANREISEVLAFEMMEGMYQMGRNPRRMPKAPREFLS